MIQLGITGGIGSGKSVVSHLLQIMEIPVYQTDDEAKKITVKDEVVRQELIALVGKDVYQKDGKLNRQLLASYVFGCSDRISSVNAIIHPRVKLDYLKWTQIHNECPLVAMECAILFESGFDKLVDKVVAVSAPLDLRIQRAVKRDSSSKEKILKRIEHQLSDDELRKKADFIIVNDDKTLLLPQVIEILHKLDIF